MTEIRYLNHLFNIRKEENLLEALLRQGADVPFSCRAGICQVCLMKADDKPDPASQKGVDPALVEKGYFLPCKCYPKNNMVVFPANLQDFTTKSLLVDKRQLSENVWEIHLEPFRTFAYKPGQFVNIFRGLNSRPYSIASPLTVNTVLEFHIKCIPDGLVSNWLCHDLQIDDEVVLGLPSGYCFYDEKSDADKDLLLVASGTGLSTCFGVFRDAISKSHRGKVVLLHGARNAEELYLHSMLGQFEAHLPNFTYIPCITEEQRDGINFGRVTQFFLEQNIDYKNLVVFISGSEAMVEETFKMAEQSGINPLAIRMDSHGDLKDKLVNTDTGSDSSDSGYPPPEPLLWHALEEGKLLQLILDEFYDIVFEDDILSPYFREVTKGRVKEKVYSFYRRLFSGDKVYFGDRPRNAHHWMVIPDSVFDYREKILTKVIKRYLPDDNLVRKWIAFEEFYRSDIVKDKPWGRKIGDIESPSGGFSYETLSIGSCCDSCTQAVDEGTLVSYNLRTGEVYCPQCHEKK